MLASFPIDGASDCSMSFWSHMKGEDVGSLAVKLRYSYGNPSGDFYVVANISGKSYNFTTHLILHYTTLSYTLLLYY